MYAADGAVGGAALGGEELAFDIFAGVVGDGHARVAALLAAVVDQAVFADVEVTRPGAAAPVVGPALGDGRLELVELGVVGLLAVGHGEKDLRFLGLEGLELAVAVVDDADGGFEAEFQGAAADGQCILGVTDASADHGVDVDVEFGVLGQHLQLLVEHLERLFGDVVGIHIINRYLHVVEAGAIEALDALDVEQIAIGDHAGDGAGFSDSLDDVIQLGMGQGLAAGDADHGRTQAAEVVDAAVHLLEGDGLGDLVVLVAVGAGEIAEARGDDLGKDGVAGGSQGASDHAIFADFSGYGFEPPSQGRSPGNGH